MPLRRIRHLPSPASAVFWIIRVTDRIENLTIFPGTAAVFRRTRPLARHAPGILHSRFGWEPFLYDQLMHPIVAEIIFVSEPRPAVLRWKNFGEPGIAGLMNLVVLHFQICVIHIADREAVGRNFQPIETWMSS